MTLLVREQATELAGRLIESSVADETEVILESSVDRFVRFADTGPTQSADRLSHSVSVRVRLAEDAGRREGKATCDSLEPTAMQATLDRALELARYSPPNPELVELGGPVELEEAQCDAATLEHGFSAKADWTRQALEACRERELLPAGLIQTGGGSVTLVTSAGREVHSSLSRASFSLTASALDLLGGSGLGGQVSARVQDLDPGAVIERAVAKAAANREPEPCAAGEYTVVLEPLAVSSILLFGGYYGFGAQEVHEKSSFLCGRIGEKLFPSGLTIVDDARNGLLPGLPFDWEGTPKQRVALVDKGVVGEPVTDRTWALKLGRENTGHARPMPNTDGPGTSNLCIEPGTESTAELIAGVERGLLVTQFHYTNMIDPKDLLLTGMTRNGTFLIENGKVTRPVRNLRFTESLVRAFGNLSGIGSELDVAGALFDGDVVCPPLRIENFRFTSTTDF